MTCPSRTQLCTEHTVNIWRLHDVMLYGTQKIPWFIILQLWLSQDEFHLLLSTLPQTCGSLSHPPHQWSGTGYCSVHANCLRHSCAVNHWQVREASLHGFYTNPSQSNPTESITTAHTAVSMNSYLKKILMLLLNCIVHSFKLSTAIKISINTLKNIKYINPYSNYWSCSYIIMEI